MVPLRGPNSMLGSNLRSELEDPLLDDNFGFCRDYVRSSLDDRLKKRATECGRQNADRWAG